MEEIIGMYPRDLAYLLLGAGLMLILIILIS